MSMTATDQTDSQNETDNRIPQSSGATDARMHRVAGAHIDYVVYGKVIIDSIRRLDGVLEREILGGGGPQGAFGARLWSPNVGFITRTGDVVEEKPLAALHALDVDLSGWYSFPTVRQPHGGMEYDENEYMRPRSQIAADLQLLSQEIRDLLKMDTPIPSAYSTPRVIHLITEYYHDRIYHDALALQKQGVILSVEPLIDYRAWTNREQTLEALSTWDIISPDWPSASGLAGSEDPATVLRFYSERGPALVTVRHGARGSYVWDKITGKAWHMPPSPVTAIDPTGAGNAYAGGAMVGWDCHRDGRIASAHGAVSASLLVERVGLPTWSPELFADADRRLEIAIEQARPL